MTDFCGVAESTLQQRENKKKLDVNILCSLREKNTFFCKSHLSLYQIVIFSYLWIENVSLKFLSKQVKISNSVAVVFDAMIARHEKIGKF